MGERQVVIGDVAEPVDRFGGVDDGVLGARVLEFDGRLTGGDGAATGGRRDAAGPSWPESDRGRWLWSAWSDWSYITRRGAWELALLHVAITRVPSSAGGVLDLQVGVLGFHVAVSWYGAAERRDRRC